MFLRRRVCAGDGSYVPLKAFFCIGSRICGVGGEHVQSKANLCCEGGYMP